MKTMFKMTLGKKIFILVFMSFVLIQVLNVTLDFHREKSHIYTQNDNIYNIDVLSQQLSILYNQKYNDLNSSFYEDIEQTLEAEDGYKIDSVFVLNPDLEMVYNLREHNTPYLMLRNENEGITTYLRINLSQIPIDQQKQIENILRKQVENNQLPVNIAFTGYDSQNNSNVSMKIDDISYLSIDKQIFLNHRQNNEKI